MNPNTYYIFNRLEAKDEAARLSRMLKRHVELAYAPCDCDYYPGCLCCAGAGAYYELRYAFCDHVVCEGDDLECIAGDCERREREAGMVERPDTWSRVGKPLVSCAEVGAREEG